MSGQVTSHINRVLIRGYHVLGAPRVDIMEQLLAIMDLGSLLQGAGPVGQLAQQAKSVDHLGLLGEIP